jgi:hypothetical protein
MQVSMTTIFRSDASVGKAELGFPEPAFSQVLLLIGAVERQACVAVRSR